MPIATNIFTFSEVGVVTVFDSYC